MAPPSAEGVPVVSLAAIWVLPARCQNLKVTEGRSPSRVPVVVRISVPLLENRAEVPSREQVPLREPLEPCFPRTGQKMLPELPGELAGGLLRLRAALLPWQTDRSILREQRNRPRSHELVGQMA